MTSPAAPRFKDSPGASWDRAIVYGDGLFETLAVFDGQVPLWDYHAARLHEGLARLGITTDEAAIAAHVRSQAAEAGDGVARLVVARAGGRRGYDPRLADEVIAQLSLFPLPSYPAAWQQEGVRLHVCHHRLPENPPLAGIKHLNRLDQVLAAAEWDRAQAAEGLMLDTAGRVIEGTVSNIFVLRAGRWHTPALTRCGVTGVMRAWLMEQATHSGQDVMVADLSLEAVLSAEAVFVCNSVFGIWPVHTIGDQSIPMLPEALEPFRASLRALGYGRLYA